MRANCTAAGGVPYAYFKPTTDIFFFFFNIFRLYSLRSLLAFTHPIIALLVRESKTTRTFPGIAKLFCTRTYALRRILYNIILYVFVMAAPIDATKLQRCERLAIFASDSRSVIYLFHGQLVFDETIDRRRILRKHI